MKVQPAMQLARARNVESLGQLWHDSNQKYEDLKHGTGGPVPKHLLTTNPTPMRALLCIFAYIARLFNPRAARRFGLHSETDRRLQMLLDICSYLDRVRKEYLTVRCVCARGGGGKG